MAGPRSSWDVDALHDSLSVLTLSDGELNVARLNNADSLSAEWTDATLTDTESLPSEWADSTLDTESLLSEWADAKLSTDSKAPRQWVNVTPGFNAGSHSHASPTVKAGHGGPSFPQERRAAQQAFAACQHCPPNTPRKNLSVIGEADPNVAYGDIGDAASAVSDCVSQWSDFVTSDDGGDAASVVSDCLSQWSDFVTSDESYVTAAADSDRGTARAELLRRLREAGQSPGPVTAGTAALYRRRLARLEARAARFTPELDACLRAMPAQLAALQQLEARMVAPLAAAAAAAGGRIASRRTCFNYLLLDPRVTARLPSSADPAAAFPQFAAAVFYVGKGQQSRPHQHLLDAASVPAGTTVSDRLEHIRAIWRTGAGVVLLIVFHHRLPDEALTREAAMIDALGLRNLTNMRAGDYYGPAKAWSSSDRRRLGVGLLYKALRMYLVEGETQLRPEDLGK